MGHVAEAAQVPNLTAGFGAVGPSLHLFDVHQKGNAEKVLGFIIVVIH